MSVTPPELAHYARALWGGPFAVSFAPEPIARSAFAGRDQVLPPPELASGGALERARAAHAAAHAVFSNARWEVGSLKPLQRVLVSLFEDARVEDLAMQSYPGLRRIWAPFHTACPSANAALEPLLARLARALFDASYDDPETWIQKARRLYWQGRALRDGVAVSRSLGGLLGNELGQMRLSLDLRQYQVEPAYRDDHSGLWLEPEASAQPQPELREDPASNACSAPRQPTAQRYPEWDYVIARQRVDFCAVREEHASSLAGPLPSAPAALARRLKNALSTPRRQRRCPEGTVLELAAVVDAQAERAAGLASAPRVYERRQRRLRRSSTLLLLDLSESANALVAPGLPGRELAAACARLLCGSWGARDLAIHGFRSFGRHDVRFTPFKEFGEAPSAALPRLARLPAAGSTRLGTAIRHGTALLRQRVASARVLLVLTDADPADVDVFDAQYLVEEARRAVQLARQAKVLVFGCCLPGAAQGQPARIFGREQGPLTRLASLPPLLSHALSRAGGARH